MKNKRVKILAATVLCLLSLFANAKDKEDNVEHHYVDNEGVKIHYAAMGKGPLIVFIHGFPDFWYSWIDQMKGLKNHYRVVAIDTRGYNKSDQPEEPAAYDLSVLAEDVAAVIRAEGRANATVVGHDWGGAIAWYLAMSQPEMTNKLIVVNFPHPLALSRELVENPEQYAMLEYARNFTTPESHQFLNTDILLDIVAPDETKRARYRAAYEQSSINSMMNYYRQNYGHFDDGYFDSFAKVKVPVLQIHGLTDIALHSDGLNGTWDWLDGDYSLVTLPGVGHWSHHERSATVTQTMKRWLKLQKKLHRQSE